MFVANFLLLLLPYVAPQTQNPDCCPIKKVSGADASLAGNYILQPGEEKTLEECKDQCTYRREGDTSRTKYCFMAGGGMSSQCQMDEVSFTTQQPPMGGEVSTPKPGQEQFSNAAFCAISQDHTMCKYPGVGSTCPAVREFGFSEAGKKLILDKHNDLRSKVAKGQENGQPKASNMRALRWSDELEVVAQRWADQCIFGHDTNRKKLDGTYVGQNAFIGMASKKTKEELMAEMDTAVQKWYDEVTDPGFDSANIDPYSFSSGTGHYTQVVWAETEELGCGWTYWEEDGWWKSMVQCNYAKGGNMQGASIYKEGEPCSACPSGYTCTEDQLCQAPAL